VITEGGHYKVTGDVTNAGLEDAKSVLVTSGSPAVPVDPFRVYVVGSLEPDDFSGFEVTFTAEDADFVPLLIYYKDDDGYNRLFVEEKMNGDPGVEKSQAVIRLDDVTKVYPLPFGDVVALDQVTLEIAAGEFIAIMGPSGSGKSTLLNLIGSLDVPTTGSLYINGRDISEMTDDELTDLRRDEIGFIFQQFNLIPLLNVLENVEYPLVLKYKGKSSSDRPLALLNKLGITEDLIPHKPSELSGGQQQRVAIARALVNDPSIMLCDEPTGNLDSKTGQVIMDLLTEVNKRGKTIIMVTHDSGVAAYAHRIINIVDGKVA